MAIDDEAVWKAEYTPAALKAFGDRVRAKLGCVVYYKGDTNHRKGRHRSRNWCLTSDYCTNPSYGTTDARDKRGPGNAIRACDVMISGRTIRLVCKGVDEAVRAGRLPELAEWFGTLDGEAVAGWFQGRPGTSDKSHLTHLHLGVWTQFVELAEFYGRLFDAMMTYIDGDDMAFLDEKDRDTGRTGAQMIKDIWWTLFRAAGEGRPEGSLVDDLGDAAADDAARDAVAVSKLDELLNRPPVQAGPVDADALGSAVVDHVAPAVRVIVREELDKTRLSAG